MALSIIGGANFLGRYLIRKTAAKGKNVRLGDMYPFRESVYALQEELGLDIQKNSLFYQSGLKLALEGAEEVVYVTHDYFKLAHSKNFLLERVAKFAKAAGVKKLTWVAPMELDQLSNLDGSPSQLVQEAESKARESFPELAVLKVDLLFGKYANSLLLQHALDQLKQGGSPIVHNDESAKFSPVYEEEFYKAFSELKPGDRVVLGGPEKLSWAEIKTALGNYTGKSVSSGANNIYGTIATNDTFGDLVFPSQVQQLYNLLNSNHFEAATKNGTKKLGEVLTAEGYQQTPEKQWHRVVLDQ